MYTSRTCLLRVFELASRNHFQSKNVFPEAWKPPYSRVTPSSGIKELLTTGLVFQLYWEGSEHWHPLYHEVQSKRGSSDKASPVLHWSPCRAMAAGQSVTALFCRELQFCYSYNTEMGEFYQTSNSLSLWRIQFCSCERVSRYMMQSVSKGMSLPVVLQWLEAGLHVANGK